MKKIGATLLLAGLIASAVMAEAKLPSSKSVHTLSATAAPTTTKRHRKHRRHRVRKLKELGLTESLEVGYRLSPRGAAFLKR